MRYAGVGSRDISEDERLRCTNLGAYLRANGVALNSGHADGADIAFEEGARISVELLHKPPDDVMFLPYAGFNKAKNIKTFIDSGSYVVPEFNERVVELVTQVVPYLNNLKFDKKTGRVSFTYHAFLRNGYQVMGRDLDTPVDFLVACSDWDGKGSVKGGTRVAWDLATCMGIPCFNIRYSDEFDRLRAWFSDYRHKDC